MTCAHPSQACKDLPFASMPVIKTYSDGVRSVRCTNHAPKNRPAPAKE